MLANLRQNSASLLVPDNSMDPKDSLAMSLTWPSFWEHYLSLNAVVVVGGAGLHACNQDSRIGLCKIVELALNFVGPDRAADGNHW